MTDIKGRECLWDDKCAVCLGAVKPGDMIYYQAARKNEHGSYISTGITKHIDCHNQTKRIVIRKTVTKKLAVRKPAKYLKKIIMTNQPENIPEYKAGDFVRISPKHAKVDFHGHMVDNYEVVYDVNTKSNKHLVDYLECLGMYVERKRSKNGRVRDIVIYGESQLSIAAGKLDKVSDEDVVNLSWNDGPTSYPVSFTRRMENRS